MGADMIGHIVIGPVEISPENIKKAAKKLFNFKKNGLVHCVNCGYEITPDTMDMKDDSCNNCGEPFLNPFGIETIGDAEEIVKDLIHDWPPDFRDCCSRMYPQNNDMIIIFAGDMSWGDSPDGSGYHLLERIINSGIYEELGLI